ncbi:MAG: carboxymuconolactone decarboxylase family protein [Rhodospirillaceae bacterium]|nr:carboxymuconolactone decarboxylase family protein [Rhodospirillaceae bacterium]
MSTRVSPAPPAQDAEGQALEERIRAARGEINPLYAALLNSPAVAHGWEQMLTAIRQKTALPAHLRELVILRIAILNQAAYEFASHLPYAKAAGVSESKLAAVRAGDLAVFDQQERLVLEYAEAMTRDIQVSDALFARVAAAFGPKDRVELTATVAAYNMVSRFLVALDIH